MMPVVNNTRSNPESLSRKNRRLAMVLGLVAASIYAGFILAYYF